MVKKEKKQGFMDKIKSGVGYLFHTVSAGIFSELAEGSEVVMDKIDNRIKLIEKRIIKQLCSLMVIGFGAVFLIFSLLFFLIEYLSWTKAVAFFSIGVIIFVVGLLLKIGESPK